MINFTVLALHRWYVSKSISMAHTSNAMQGLTLTRTRHKTLLGCHHSNRTPLEKMC